MLVWIAPVPSMYHQGQGDLTTLWVATYKGFSVVSHILNNFIITHNCWEHGSAWVVLVFLVNFVYGSCMLRRCFKAERDGSQRKSILECCIKRIVQVHEKKNSTDNSRAQKDMKFCNEHYWHNTGRFQR